MGEGEMIKLQRVERSGMDEGTARLALAIDNRSSQEACRAYNQLKDKRTDYDIAVLRRSITMSFYSTMWRPGRSLLTNPLTKKEACCNTLIQALMSGQGRHVSTALCGDSRPSNEVRSLPGQVKTSLHVWTGRHEVSVSVRQ